MMLIRYEMDSDFIEFERVIYSMFDLMGDIGGFNEALRWVAMLTLFFIHFQPLNLHLVRNLFIYGSTRLNHPDPEA